MAAFHVLGVQEILIVIAIFSLLVVGASMATLALLIAFHEGRKDDSDPPFRELG